MSIAGLMLARHSRGAPMFKDIRRHAPLFPSHLLGGGVNSDLHTFDQTFFCPGSPIHIQSACWFSRHILALLHTPFIFRAYFEPVYLELIQPARTYTDIVASPLTPGSKRQKTTRLARGAPRTDTTTPCPKRMSIPARISAPAEAKRAPNAAPRARTAAAAFRRAP